MLRVVLILKFFLFKCLMKEFLQENAVYLILSIKMLKWLIILAFDKTPFSLETESHYYLVLHSAHRSLPAFAY